MEPWNQTKSEDSSTGAVKEDVVSDRRGELESGKGDVGELVLNSFPNSAYSEDLYDSDFVSDYNNLSEHHF